MLLQWFNPSGDFIEKSSFGHVTQMLDNVYKGVLHQMPVAVVRFAMAAAVCNIMAETPYSPVLAHAAIFRVSEIDWSVPDCPGKYNYDYRSADVREVAPTHSGGRKLPCTKPRARKGVTMSHLINIKEMVDVMGEKDRLRWRTHLMLRLMKGRLLAP